MNSKTKIMIFAKNQKRFFINYFQSHLWFYNVNEHLLGSINCQIDEQKKT